MTNDEYCNGGTAGEPAMLTADGCRERRKRLWNRLQGASIEEIALADPIHLRYFANADFDPFSYLSDMPAVLVIDRDGAATLVIDRKSPKSVEAAHADEIIKTDWYPGTSPGQGPRQLALDSALAKLGVLRLHDRFGDPLYAIVVRTVAEMRRAKDPDEIAVMRACMKATDAGHA